MESEKRIEQSSLPEGGAEGADLSRETQQIADFLKEVSRALNKGEHKQAAEKSKHDLLRQVRFIFRPYLDLGRGEEVVVEATEFHFSPQPRDPHAPTPLRNFHITLRGPEPNSFLYHWNIEELSGDHANYELSFTKRDSIIRVHEEWEAPLPADFERYRDPRIQEISEAARLMREAWNLYREGDRTAVELQYHRGAAMDD